MLEAPFPSRFRNPVRCRRLYGRTAYPAEVSRQDPAHHLSEQRYAEEVHILYQCIGYQSGHGCRTIPSTMEYRTVFQVAEAAPQDKKVLGRVRKRCQDPDLCSHYNLLHDGDCAEKDADQAVHL